MSTKAAAITAPTELLPTDAARTYTHIVPSLVLALLYMSFSYIVADPVTWLSYLLLPVSVLQCSYCIICLPPASTEPVVSSANAASSTPKAAATQATSKRKGGATGTKTSTKTASITEKISSSIIAIILSLTIVPLALFVVVVLHGAPLTTHHAHTALLALHMSVLSAPGLWYTQGVSGARWRDLLSLSAPVDEVLGGALGTFIGAWLGAIPIPLDWDREWQKWPVTIVAGSYVGWAVGRLACGWLLKGRRIHFEDY